MIRTALIFSALALPLSACGGDGDDALADKARDNYEAAADTMDDMAANATTDAAADAMEANAQALREAGSDKADAIDDSDVDADELTADQKNAMTTVQ